MTSCEECANRAPHSAELFAHIQDKEQSVIATLTPSISQDHLLQAARWIPALQRHRTPDAAWNWAERLRETVGTDPHRFEGCALVVGTELQGLAILDRGHERTRDGSSAPLVYLEYLAVAPENRRTLQFPTRTKHCGKMLLYYCRHRSVSLGLAGRLGLHSLADPDTEAFYRSRGMRDFGPDSDVDDLRYFEFGPDRYTGDMAVLRLPKDWLGDDFELEVAGRRMVVPGTGEVIRADAQGDLKISCLIHNAADLTLTAGAISALSQLIAELLAKAAHRAQEQARSEITESDVSASRR